MTLLLCRSAGSRDPRKSLYVAMLAGVLLLLGIPTAVAHDELTESEPAPNSSLEEPPQQLMLRFSGDLTTLGAQVQVTGPLGSATEGDPVIEGSQVHQDLSAAGGSGDYEVIWRATSEDGHPISGSFGYTVLGAGESEGPPPSKSDDSKSTPTGENTTPQGASTTPTQDGEEAATSTAQAKAQADQAARTDAVVIASEPNSAAGRAPWMWALIGVALVALAGVGIVAVRRR